MFVKNKYLDQLTAIFDENNQNYVSDRSTINNSEFDKIVYVTDNKSVAYAVIYQGTDFCEKRRIPNNY